MSAIYGNGYDKCGPYDYTYTDMQNEPFSLHALSNKTHHNNGYADNITFYLDSYPNGKDLTTNFTMRVSLRNYPSSYYYSQVVNVTYRECFPEDFSGPMIHVDPMTVGDEGFEIDTFFDQYPCNYVQEYTI